MNPLRDRLLVAGDPCRLAVSVTTPSMSKLTAANAGAEAEGRGGVPRPCGSPFGGCGGVAGWVGVEGGGAVRRAEVVGDTVDLAASGGRLGVDGHAADRVDG